MTRDLIRAIFAHTDKDSRDRLYYRVSIWEPWKRLRTEEDYRELNRVIDKYRRSK